MADQQNGRRVRQRPNPAETCTKPGCVAVKCRLGSMCAAFGMQKREADALRTRVAILQQRQGGDGLMPAGVPRVNVQHEEREERQLSKYMLSERLKLYNKNIEGKEDQSKLKEQVPVLEQMFKQLEATINSLDDEQLHQVDELFPQYQSLGAVLTKAKAELEPYQCNICGDDLESGKIILGKNCYHTHCFTCVTRLAMERFRPCGLIRVDNNPYWIVAGTQAEDGRGELYNYVLREEVQQQLDNGTASFPEGIEVACPLCRHPQYADKPYYNACVELQAKPLDSPVDAAGGDGNKTPEEQVAAWRAQGHFLLLAVPGDPSKVMLVKAKIYGASDPEGMPVYTDVNNVARAAGFKPAKNLNVEGHPGTALHRDLVPGEEVDELPLGAELNKTRQTRKPQTTFSHEDEEGRRHYVEERALQGGGQYRVDLPKPTPADEVVSP